MEKWQIESFVVIGGLTQLEYLLIVGASKSRYLGINIYQVASK
jgi:hypothetical protein